MCEYRYVDGHGWHDRSPQWQLGGAALIAPTLECAGQNDNRNSIYVQPLADDSDVNQWETGSDAGTLELWGTARKGGNNFGVC